MTQLCRAALLAVAGPALATAVLAQAPVSRSEPSRDSAAGFLPVPPNVKAAGLPPIPASIVQDLAPYASSRRALLLGWHPSRRQILVTTAFDGNTFQIHSVAGPGMDRQQLTFFPTGAGIAAGGVAAGNVGAWYSSDGSYVLFSKDATSGGEAMQLFRFDLATRKTTLLTDGKSRNGLPVWSHRSGLIAFESTRRGGHGGADRDLWVMDPTNASSARLVCEVEGNWSVADWSPDDSELLVVNAPAANTRSSVWRVNVKSGQKTPISPEGNPAVWRSPVFSPDGRYVYVLSNRDSETLRLWRGELANGTWKPITAETDDLESFALSPDGRNIAAVFDSTTSSRVELIDAKTFKVRWAPKLPAGQLLGRSPLWRADSSEVAFSLWSLRTFGDVFSVNARTGAVERWTKSEFGAFDPDSLPEPEIIRWKSFDGLTISGVLYRPPARFTGPRPVVITIHGGPGGPTSRERPRYQGRSAYLLNELGIALVFPNVRGSWGFGKAFGRLDDGMKREDSVKDIGALLDWIETQPALDKNRVMVNGVSYGGYMTYAVAEMYSSRLRGALAAAGISDFISYLETTDPTRPEDRRAEYGDERVPEMRDFLKRISPITNASKLRIPLFIVHGANDTRVRPAQAEEMARIVRANGVPVWLTIYGDEGHEFWARAANNNFWFYTWITFIKQYLLN
ncbi:MAG TPA: prolyl oligopeptidase family serine peptidase [Vicinamibacterales bacterium]|nr:prolyl oligopeptidase family serine peptidase [Vicinamibacterales bacterium]